MDILQKFTSPFWYHVIIHTIANILRKEYLTLYFIVIFGREKVKKLYAKSNKEEHALQFGYLFQGVFVFCVLDIVLYCYSHVWPVADSIVFAFFWIFTH